MGRHFHQVLTGLGGAAVVAVVGDSPIPFALVGMAALFTATVRAPLTGVVLIIEMSGTASLTTAMFAAAAAALFAAVLLKGRPIYDSLRARMLAGGTLQRG